MSDSDLIGGLVEKILAVHELLDSMKVPHQFGGAIALAWYRRPRATTDIDLNLTVSPTHAAPVLGALGTLGIQVGSSNAALIKRDGQARLEWGATYLDVFFATIEFHYEIEKRQRMVEFAGTMIPIMSPEHLIVCKAIFDRPKDWVDIEAIVDWGTALDRDETLRWVGTILGPDSAPLGRLRAVLGVPD